MKNKKNNIQEIEVTPYKYGPFILEQKGNVVRMRSTESRQEFEKRIEYIKSQKDVLKNDIDKSIKEVVETLKRYNPFEFLAITNILVSNKMNNIENETEYKFEYSVLTYLQNIVTCFSPNEFYLVRKPNIEIATILFEQIEEIMMNTVWYKATADIGKENEDLIFKAFSKNQFQHHTPSYPQHHIELFHKLFYHCSPFLKKYFNLEFQEIYDLLNKIKSSIKENFDNINTLKQKYIEGNHKEFFSEENGVNSENFIEKIKEMQNQVAHDEEYLKLIYPMYYNFFKISNLNEAEKRFIDLISIQLGDNRSVFGNKDYFYWASNESITKFKPIIKFNNSYFCLNYQLLFENIFYILESIIKTTDMDYFDRTYQKKYKADTLEKLSVEYFTKLLPGCKCYQSCYYDIVEDGENKQCEADVIILYDNNIFLIEAKSGVLTSPARQGSVLRIKNDTEKLIENAYSQCIRTKNYIQNNAIAIFTDGKRKEKILEIKNAKYDNYFLINTTLEDLNLYSAHLNSLKVFNFLNRNELIWSVFINDLRIISEIIQTPSEFLSYLKNRIRLNDIAQIESNDELDYFGYHLTKGLYFDEKDLKDYSQFNLGNHTISIDEWYMGKTSVKPTFQISDKFKNLILKIESLNKHGFSEVTTLLIDQNSISQDEIIDKLDFNLLDYLCDHKTHFKVASDKISKFHIFFFIYGGDNSELSKFESYVRSLIYSKKVIKAFILIQEYQYEKLRYDFRYIK